MKIIMAVLKVLFVMILVWLIFGFINKVILEKYDEKKCNKDDLWFCFICGPFMTILFGIYYGKILWYYLYYNFFKKDED